VGKEALLSSASSAVEAARLLKQKNRKNNTAQEDAPEIVEEDDVLSSLPSVQGGQDTAESRLKEARERMAPIDPSSALVLRHKKQAQAKPKPEWHAPWQLYRVISGHNGWVRCIDVDVTNEFFATGSNDRCIKIWDLASGTLKLTLTGHISSVRSINISDRHPYLFSVGEDKLVKCWDLERNQVFCFFFFFF
jgi:pleiotropic regulator 1